MSVDPPEGARTVAGRYRLGELLGKGGMGAVWRAQDELLGREVALKRLRLADLPEEEVALARERTMREARIAASLHHPRVVSIFDVVVEDGEPWLVLEYLPSVSLGRMVREQGPLPVSDVAAIGAQIADALAAAHAAGIVHRDVKPDNVLVAGNVAKLTDFGISHGDAAPGITLTGMIAGTPAYLAPETCRGEGTDARSDVYALGATLYAAVEGAPPFGTGGDLLALIGRIARGQAPPAQRAGPLTGLLGAMLADPRARPPAAHVRDVLSQLAATGPAENPTTAVPTVHHARPVRVPPGPPSPGPAPHPRPSPRRGVAIALVAVAGLVVLAGLGVFGYSALSRAGGTASGTASGTAATLGDARTADPCSLIDVAALAPHGEATLDPTNVSFSGCRADLSPPSGGEVALFVEFSLPPASTDLVGTPQKAGAVEVHRLRTAGNVCARELLLPDGNIVAVYAQRFDDGADDLCAIAESAAQGATRILNTRGVGTREPLDATSPLAHIDACTLLSAKDVAVVVGTGGTGTPGFGRWSCSWSTPSQLSVYVNYYRGRPPTPGGLTTVMIAGHTAAAAPAIGRCRIELMQRRYLSDLGERADLVQLTVYGTETDQEVCREATSLATAAARVLPPPT